MMKPRHRRRAAAQLSVTLLEDRTVPTTFAGPITITAGGTYTGNWESQDPNVPAVTIATAAPVVLVNCQIQGRGTLISSSVSHADITIRGCWGYGLNPNVAGKAAGRFADIENFDNVVIENNFLEGTGGIYLLDYRGDHTSADTVKVLRNRAHNIDGRRSDGHGGYLAYNEQTINGVTQEGYKYRQFFQMDKVLDVPNMEVAWNEVINDPGLSRVEDNINIYESRGTPTSHLQIHDNYIRGAFTIRPGQASYADVTGSYDWSFSGGGILLGDGNTTDPALVPGYADVFNNQVINTTNYGVAIAGGHDQSITNNRVVSGGFLGDGTWVTAQNVGAYIWDSYHLGSGVFYNNVGSGNQSGWVNTPTGARNDWWVPGASSWTGNVHWSGTVTAATETGEYAYWQNKLAANGVTVGPAQVAPPTTPTTPPVSSPTTPTPPAVNPPSGSTAIAYAVGAASGEPRVWLYNADGTLQRTFLAYDKSFTGGVRVATADVNGDGVLDVVTGTGPGGAPHVKVFDGKSLEEFRSFFAYDASFTGGVSVAAADLTGDGKADIVTGTGPGGGPHVKAFDVARGKVVASYYAYDREFRGGVNVAAGDVTGDGLADIVTGAGAGGGPHLRVWSKGKVVAETFALDRGFTGGLSVAVGDFDGDRKADIAVGPQAGGPARVRVLNGSLTVIKDVAVSADDYRGGTSLAMHDLDAGGRATVLVGVNRNGKPAVVGVRNTGDVADLLTPDPAMPGAVFVG